MNRLNRLEVFYHNRLVRTSGGRWRGGKIHMVSAAGLLETSHRIHNLDYKILMKLTFQLTKSMEECEKLYRNRIKQCQGQENGVKYKGMCL